MNSIDITLLMDIQFQIYFRYYGDYQEMKPKIDNLIQISNMKKLNRFLIILNKKGILQEKQEIFVNI